jgi:hypothetical protein
MAPSSLPTLQLLSNGRHHARPKAAGGYSLWNGVALTRRHADAGNHAELAATCVTHELNYRRRETLYRTKVRPSSTGIRASGWLLDGRPCPAPAVIPVDDRREAVVIVRLQRRGA